MEELIVEQATMSLKRSIDGPESESKRITPAENNSQQENGREPTPTTEIPVAEGAEETNEEETKQEVEATEQAEAEEAEEPTEEQEDVDDDVDERAEDQEKNDPHRLQAIEALTAIELEFASLRDQIHSDQTARFDLELLLCSMGTHPELQAVQERIQGHYEDQTKRSKKGLEYQLKCISNQTRAMRDHLHQQFLKDRHDVRTQLLRQTTREWYQVNDERRAADKLVPEFGYRADTIPPQNTEVPLLVAISRYKGFPAAPKIMGANEEEIINDLSNLRLGVNERSRNQQ